MPKVGRYFANGDVEKNDGELEKKREKAKKLPKGDGLLDIAVKKAALRQKMMDATARGDFEAAERYRKQLQGF